MPSPEGGPENAGSGVVKVKMTVDVGKLVGEDLSNESQEVDPELKILSKILGSSPELVIAIGKGPKDRVVKTIDIYDVKFSDGSVVTLDKSEKKFKRNKLSNVKGVDSVGKQIAILSHEYNADPKGIELKSWTATDGEKGDVDNKDIVRKFDLRYPQNMNVVMKYLSNLNPNYQSMSLQKIGGDLRRRR